jgi:hypothetical protein
VTYGVNSLLLHVGWSFLYSDNFCLLDERALDVARIPLKLSRGLHMRLGNILP